MIGRWAASLVSLLTAACVGLPPGAPASDETVSDAATGTTTAGETDPGGPTTGIADGTSSDTDTSDETGPSFDPVCGDGIVETPEECDLGQENGAGMYCTATCTANACGDGYVGPGESCDDANAVDDDQCTNLCGPAGCGDGVVQGKEECDAARENSEGGACLPSCVAAACGDLFVYAGMEACDGSNIGAESCETQGFGGGVLLCAVDCTTFDTSNCQLCDNGVLEPGETCDTDVFEGGVTCQEYAPAGTVVSGGALVCADTCATIDASACTFCGDEVLGGAEPCEGAELGGATCTTVMGDGYRGELACSADCMLDTTACCVATGGPCNADSECCSNDCSQGPMACS